METGQYVLQRGAKNVCRTVVLGKLKTAKSARKAILPAFVMQALREHRHAQLERHLQLGLRPVDGFVFDRLDSTGWDPNELSRMFHRFVQRHPELRRIRFHDLRHANATSGLASGASLKVISESLGHSSISVTSSVYVDVLDPAKQDLADRLDAYLGDAIRAGLRNGTAKA